MMWRREIQITDIRTGNSRLNNNTTGVSQIICYIFINLPTQSRLLGRKEMSLDHRLQTGNCLLCRMGMFIPVSY